ncbi:MAG: BREX-1 system phosphatase PglZ type B [Chloroflexi bacterium]|nr:BREX-1 system phosphatase PglZ type B [Chloroflexota bacterium]
MLDQPTVFEILIEMLHKAATYNRNEEVPPAVILWPDKESQWVELALRLQSVLPDFYILGNYDPEKRTGPAIWLRCLLTDSPSANAGNMAPVFYLPGVSRQDLRAVEECPKHLQPLAELQYRGCFWSHSNGKDWTILAFLQSADGGLDLEVSRDEATQEAMKRALTKLVDEPVARLRGRKLAAADFNELVTPDAVRDLLEWLDTPQQTHARWDTNQRQAFRSVCQQKYKFDPQQDGELTGAQLMASKAGHWAHVWQRFAEAPNRYPHLPQLLSRARPLETLSFFGDRSVWPQDNAEMEDSLRKALEDLKDRSPAEARRRIRNLENEHGARRGWVWAALGLAPLAQALEHMALLATATEKPLGGATPEDMAAHYADEAWRADSAVVEALLTLDDANADCIKAIKAAIKALYQPWLGEAAETFQQLVKQHPLPGCPARSMALHEQTTAAAPPAGLCILFADGLRFDVAQRVKTAFQQSGFEIQFTRLFAALPTVTATAKPAISPVADLLGSNSDVAKFEPTVTATGQIANIDQLRQLLYENGYQVLLGDDLGSPDDTQRRAAWTEYGQLDKLGHEIGIQMVSHIPAQVRGIVDRAKALISAGWREVQIVTDHGWLLVPGGLPKVTLPSYLAESRWGRCATPKTHARIELQTVSWHWDPEVRIAVTPGIGCFIAGKEYAHGGLSVQECVIPVLRVINPASHAASATIKSIKWVGLRCRIQIAGQQLATLRADIRTKAADPTTSLAAEVKSISANGDVSLVAPDDQHMGASAIVVVIDETGSIVARVHTEIGQS